MTTRYASKVQSRMLGLALSSCLLGGCAGAEPGDTASEGPAVAASSLALADSAEELAGRDLAGHAIDAQPVETQRRFFQAHLMTQQQGLAAAKELVDNLTQAQGKKEFAADRTNLGEQLKDARKRLEARQERIRELQEKLARL